MAKTTISTAIAEKLVARGLCATPPADAEALFKILPARLVKFQDKHRIHRLTAQMEDGLVCAAYLCADCGGVMFQPARESTLADALAALWLRLDDQKLIPTE